MSELRHRVKVDDKGRLTIPTSIRAAMEIKNGSILQVYPLNLTGTDSKTKFIVEVLVK
jgi:AbrB family looped-hinge helix DNA binding protein